VGAFPYPARLTRRRFPADLGQAREREGGERHDDVAHRDVEEVGVSMLNLPPT
jgi:hypothetical protein